MGKVMSRLGFKTKLRFGGFGAAPAAPLAFNPKPKDESNKLRRKNSLFDAIVRYLDALGNGEEGVVELVSAQDLVVAQQKIKKEITDDPRIAGLNKIADEVRSGNYRTLRNQITNHFKTVNRRYQGRHAQNSLLHITAQEGYLKMVQNIVRSTIKIATHPP